MILMSKERTFSCDFLKPFLSNDKAVTALEVNMMDLLLCQHKSFILSIHFASSDLQ